MTNINYKINLYYLPFKEKEIIEFRGSSLDVNVFHFLCRQMPAITLENDFDRRIVEQLEELQYGA